MAECQANYVPACLAMVDQGVRVVDVRPEVWARTTLSSTPTFRRLCGPKPAWAAATATVAGRIVTTPYRTLQQFWDLTRKLS